MDSLISGHMLYKVLGDNTQERCANYRKMLVELDIAKQES